MNVISVDHYLTHGCGRCAHYGTPACKVHRWAPELAALRALVLASGLEEQVKWGCPCYTLAGKNVVMVSALKEFCALQFFKGALLSDPARVLESPGPSSRHARYLKVRSLDELDARRAAAAQLLDEAIAIERAGARVAADGAIEPLPDELVQALDADPALARAFDALTPGRRRSHALHVASAKQSDTRARRAARCASDILAGRGFNER